jgi:hypothetical protein
VCSGRESKLDKPDTINFERLEQDSDESGLDGLVAAPTDYALYLSRASSHYAPGWDRMSVVVWPRWGWPSLVVPNGTDGLAKATTWFDDVRADVARDRCLNCLPGTAQVVGLDSL